MGDGMLGSTLTRLKAVAMLRQGIAGHVDRVESGTTIVGWAADLSALDRRLVVECLHDGRVLTTAVAGEFRADLKDAGVGDGCHGFRLEPPADLFYGLRDPVVHVRVAGTDRVLGPSDVRLQTDVFLWFVAADITSNCNLRCPFCLVDYSGVTKTEVMSESTFGKLMQLVGTVPDGEFYISCLHEPTLHPRLNTLLELIPEHGRKKIFFTTNLARPLKTADFEAWARSGLHHINVSLDTLDAGRFAVLRKFGRLDVFTANLDRLAETFARTPGAPPLRFITMAFKSNLDEIIDLVRISRERWGGAGNDIRYTFNVAHITDEFRRREYLDRSDWDGLTARLNACAYPVHIAYPPNEGYEALLEAPSFFQPREKKAGPTRVTFTRPMGLRAGADGTVLVSDAEDALRVNINSLDDPVHFFRSLVRQTQPRNDGVVLML
jgi:hypothetical protein